MEVNEHPILRGLLEKFGLASTEDRRQPAAKATAAVKTDVEAERRLREFRSGLNKILWQKQTDISDRVYLISLEKIREKLGATWSRSKEKIHETVRAIIEQRLTPRDLFTRYDDERYLVVFSALGKKEAQLKCSLISQEIIQRLVGPDEMSDYMAVKTVSIGKDGQIHVKDLPSVQNLLEDVIEQLDRTAENAESSEQQAISPVKRDEVADLDGVRFIFRPLLAVRTQIISTFLAIPVRSFTRDRYLSGYQVLHDSGSPSQIYSLDTLTVRRIATELSNLEHVGGRSLLALPVHYETVADFDRRRTYANLCATHLAHHNNRIIFELVGLPEGVPQSRLLELVSALRPLGRAVIARFLPEHRIFTAYRTAGLHAVGIDIFEAGKSEKRLMKEMDDFVQCAKKNQLKTYVEGIRSVSLFTAAIAAGFDYIAGYALSPVVESAEDIHAFKLETMYLSLLHSLQSSPQGR